MKPRLRKAELTLKRKLCVAVPFLTILFLNCSLRTTDLNLFQSYLISRYKERYVRSTGFPRWNTTTGIPIDPLVSYTLGVLNGTFNYSQTPTAVYVIDDNFTLWKSNRKELQIRNDWKRSTKSEMLSLHALAVLERAVIRNNSHPWPALQRAIQTGGGFPFLAYFNDFSGCNKHNWKAKTTEHSIPIFTLCGRLDCDFAFPWPTYQSILLSKFHEDQWLEVMAERQANYSIKKPQAVWRGSLTGSFQKELNESLRWRLCQIATSNNILDARLTNIPSWRKDANLTLVGGMAPKMNMEKFQEYAAVVDVDGNSWSSRFSVLLCMDVVVLKVEPSMVDYFYHQLTPWVHYIPVEKDLNDIILKIQWVLDHPMEARRIIRNANGWCSTHMLRSNLARDVLALWNSYAEYLDVANPSWNRVWREAKTSIFLEPSYDMRTVGSFFIKQT